MSRGRIHLVAATNRHAWSLATSFAALFTIRSLMTTPSLARSILER